MTPRPPSRAALLACALALGAAPACGPTWTADAVLERSAAAADADGDGRLTAADHAVWPAGAPPFAALDTDRDGSLSTAELEVLIRAQDPLTFDGQVAPPAPDLAAGPGLTVPDRAAALAIGDLLVSLRDAAEARDPRFPLPRPEVLRAAAASGSLDSPEVRRERAHLEFAFAQVGLEFPRPLFPPAPAAPAAGSPTPPEPDIIEAPP